MAVCRLRSTAAARRPGGPGLSSGCGAEWVPPRAPPRRPGAGRWFSAMICLALLPAPIRPSRVRGGGGWLQGGPNLGQLLAGDLRDASRVVHLEGCEKLEWPGGHLLYPPRGRRSARRQMPAPLLSRTGGLGGHCRQAVRGVDWWRGRCPHTRHFRPRRVGSFCPPLPLLLLAFSSSGCVLRRGCRPLRAVLQEVPGLRLLPVGVRDLRLEYQLGQVFRVSPYLL